MAVIPYAGIATESFLLVANDDLKLQLINTSTKICRKTVLGPSFAGLADQFCVIAPHANHGGNSVLAFATDEKVSGGQRGEAKEQVQRQGP